MWIEFADRAKQPEHTCELSAATVVCDRAFRRDVTGESVDFIGEYGDAVGDGQWDHADDVSVVRRRSRRDDLAGGEWDVDDVYDAGLDGDHELLGARVEQLRVTPILPPRRSR